MSSIDNPSLFEDSAPAAPLTYVAPPAEAANGNEPVRAPPSASGVFIVPTIDGRFLVRVVQDDGTTSYEWRWERQWLEALRDAVVEVLR